MFTARALRTLSKVIGGSGQCYVGLLLVSSGCVSGAAAVHTSRAATAVEHARRTGAALSAPYELTLAEAYLQEAREESSLAHYEDAIRYAKAARVAADKAATTPRNQRGPSP